MHLNLFTSWNVDERVEAKVKNTCFKHFLKIPKGDSLFKLNLKMLASVLHFYDEDEDCFVFMKNNIRFTVDLGLEDILYITGLPINGKQVYIYFVFLFHIIHLTCLCWVIYVLVTIGVQVSGIEYGDATEIVAKHLNITRDMANKLLVHKKDKKSRDIDLRELKRKYMNVPDNISDKDLDSHVKAYLLYLFGSVLFNTSSSGTVSCIYLPLLELDDIDNYAWGAAVIAALKVSMANTRKNWNSGKQSAAVNGCTYALMVRYLPIYIIHLCLSKCLSFSFSCRYLHWKDLSASASYLVLLNHLNFLC